MRRALLLSSFMMLATVGMAFGQADEPAYTQLRHGHNLRLLCQADKPIEITLHAVSASRGYSDDTSYELIGPSGATLARGVITVGKSEQFSVIPKLDGCCVLSADPLRNAFAAQVEGADWVVDVSDDQAIDVINTAGPLRIRVPAGVDEFELTFTGEEATIEVLRPDGSPADTVHVPQYETVSRRFAARAQDQDGFWTLNLDLSEDLSIRLPRSFPGLVADYPIGEEAFRRLQHGGALSSFDRRPLSEAVFKRETSAPVDAIVGASRVGGYELGFSGDGGVLGFLRGKRPLGAQDGLPAGGFMARDVAAGSGLVKLQGRVRQVNGGLDISGAFPDLDVALSAKVHSRDGAAVFEGQIMDTRGEDRAISLYFLLPVDASGGLWFDDVNSPRKIAGDGLYSNDTGCAAGANGYHSVYPLACVTGQTSAAIVVDPSRPRIFRLGYEAGIRGMFCVFDMGLCPDASKIPSRAEFHFAVFRPVDDRWGFRSALEGYYSIYPETFAKRIPKDGGWICWNSMVGIPEPDKTGMMYHWGVTTSGEGQAVRYDDEIDTFSLIYNDSVRFFMDLGAFDERPTAAQANERFKGFVDAPDPLAFVLDAPEKATGRSRWLSLGSLMSEQAVAARARRCQQAVRQSYSVNADGEMIPGYIINRKDWGPDNWWTGRLSCNPDPDIPGGYGRFLLNDVIGAAWRYLEDHGAQPDGIGLDNYFVNANNLNYRREHFQYVDTPLVFDRAGRLAICGDFQLLEWVKWLKEHLEARDCYLIPNGPRTGWPFFAHYMDIFGLEWNYQTEGVQFYHRSLARTRPVVTLPLKPEHYTEEWVKLHLSAGMLPGGYGGRRELMQADHPYRKLIEAYMPVLQAMSRAGWEPITHANGLFRLERFGRAEGGAVYWSVRNPQEETVKGKVFFDLSAAGFPTGRKVQISNALDGDVLTVCPAVQVGDEEGGIDPVVAELELAAGDATVLKAILLE